jgi:hypothetical protein
VSLVLSARFSILAEKASPNLKARGAGAAARSRAGKGFPLVE